MSDQPDPAPGGDFDPEAFIASRERNLGVQDSEFNAAADKLQAAAAAANIRRVGLDRSIISGTIIFTYAIAVVLAIYYILYKFPECTPETVKNCKAIYGAWENQAAVLRDLITTAVLPVVTLMLGFYFGTETARKSNEQSES